MVRPSSTARHFDLVEHRAVGGVQRVGAEAPARADHVHRQRAGQHGADLHRRGVRAQHHAGPRRMPVGPGHEDGVLHLARRVVGREVQRVEVEPLGLDLGPLGDLVAHGRRTRRRAARATVVTGCLAPARRRSHGSVTSTVSSTSTRASRSASSSACRAASACADRAAGRADALARPRPWPAAAARRSRALARASGARSPAWASRAAFSSSRSRGGGDGGERLVAAAADLLGRQRGHLYRVIVLLGADIALLSLRACAGSVQAGGADLVIAVR